MAYSYDNPFARHELRRGSSIVLGDRAVPQRGRVAAEVFGRAAGPVDRSRARRVDPDRQRID